VTQPPPVFARAVPPVARRAMAEPRAATATSGRVGEEALLALALVVLAGLGGAGAWILTRRRREPPASGDTVEAELQEILAEERARDDAEARV
jgi:hypothetical protein